MNNVKMKRGKEDEEYDDDEKPSSSSKKTKRSSQACIYCQRLKMKCSGSFPCERCLRVGRECKLPQQTVRQPWSRKKDLEIKMLNTRLEEMEKKLHDKEAGTSYPSGASDASTSTPYHSTISMPTAETVQTTDSSSIFSSAVADSSARVPLPFVASGRLKLDEARELFELFMHNCVLHVALVDPEWHSYARVSRDCPFLFACVVYIAAAYHHDRATLQEELKPEMDILIGKIITSGEKNVSIVQGFLFLYFFNTPAANAEKDTAWVYSGIAIRIAVELNLGSPNKLGQESARERVDRERTWMMTFVVDRSLSTTRGKSWTIRGDDSIIRKSDYWCDQPACRSWDLAICTLADLLKVTSRQIDALNTTLSASSDYEDSFDCETMMRIMNEELEEWRRRWQQRGIFNSPLESDNSSSSQGGVAHSNASAYSSPRTDVMDIHKRTLHYLSKQGALRFNYAVLVLNSFGLQYCASHPGKSAARTYSLTQAIRAAQNIVMAARDGLRYTVAYAPHSQCTILTFGIVSLIKLASLRRDDQIVSQRLLRMVESGIAFLESVAIRPTHVAARSASFLRGLLRKSLLGESAEAAFRPGMEVHSLPARSSRPSTPIRDAMSINGDMMMSHPPMPPPIQQQSSHQHPSLDPTLHASGSIHQPQPTAMYDANGNVLDTNLSWNFVGSDALDMLADADPTLLFGKEGSTGFGGLTAEELLNDSFWLRLPQRGST